MTSSAAVNVPVNEKVKEQDVNNKLQLYGIYSAFANGKVPSVSSLYQLLHVQERDLGCTCARDHDQVLIA
jgi:hypothetical protein